MSLGQSSTTTVASWSTPEIFSSVSVTEPVVPTWIVTWPCPAAATAGRNSAGRVRVTDSGSLTWQRDHWQAGGIPEGEGDWPGEAPDPRVIALDIATTVAGAIRQGSPAERGPAAPSQAS